MSSALDRSIEDPGSPAGLDAATARRPWAAVDVLALLALAGSAVAAPLLGAPMLRWFAVAAVAVAVLLVWASGRWSRRDKIIATGFCGIAYAPFIAVAVMALRR